MHETYTITPLNKLTADNLFTGKVLMHSINAPGTRSIATFRQGKMAFFNIEEGKTHYATIDSGDTWNVVLSSTDLRAITISAPDHILDPDIDYWILGLWNIDTYELLSRLKTPEYYYHWAASADLSLVMGARGGEITWWKPRENKCLGSASNPHSRGIYRVAVSENGILGASIPEVGKEAILWDIDAKKPINSISLPKPGLFSKRDKIGEIRFRDNRLYMGSSGGKVWVTDVSGKMPEKIIDTGVKSWIMAFDIHEKSGLVALHFWEGRMQLWDTNSGKLVGAAFTGHEEGKITDIRIKPDASSVLTAGKDGMVREWSINRNI